MFLSNTQKEKQNHFAHLAWSPSPASLCSLLVLLFTSFLKRPITSPSLTVMCYSVEHEILPIEARPANEGVWIYIERRNWGFANAALNSRKRNRKLTFGRLCIRGIKHWVHLTFWCVQKKGILDTGVHWELVIAWGRGQGLRVLQADVNRVGVAWKEKSDLIFQ